MVGKWNTVEITAHYADKGKFKLVSQTAKQLLIVKVVMLCQLNFKQFYEDDWAFKSTKTPPTFLLVYTCMDPMN